MKPLLLSFTAVSGICVALCAPAGAQIFSENFDGLTGLNLNGAPSGQVTTAHDLGVGGSLSGWSTAGAGTIHAVDTANTWPGPTANPPNWGVMIWQDNVITQSAAISGSNDNGTQYRIDFLAAGAVYEAAGQDNDGSTDQLQIEVLRASDSAVLHTFDHTPAPPVGAGDLGLLPVSFNYAGDGSGDILFRIGPGNANQGRFQGTIDELELSIADPGALGIASFTATPDVLGDAGEVVSFDWLVTGLPLDSLVITPGDIDVLGETDGAGEGSYMLDPGPDGTTEFTLTAGKDDQRVERKVTVTLPAPEIVSFEISPAAAGPGEAAMFSWEVGLPVTTLTLTPGDIDLLPHTDLGGVGAFTLASGPDETTSYTLTATRGSSESSASAIRSVIDPGAIFFEDFNGLTAAPGNFNGGPDGQATTTHDLVFGASLSGWTNVGAGSVHAVDTNNTWTGGAVTANAQNWGVLIWQDNVITQATAIAGSNETGTGYRIDFLAAGAVYQLAGQANDGSTDNLLIEVLRASDSAVLHAFNHTPAAPVGVGELGLLPVGFGYTGDGSGDILFRIEHGNGNQNRFQATIDDLMLTVDVAGPGAPFAITQVVRDPGTSAVTITFDSVDGAAYELWGSPDLQSWQDLENDVTGEGESTQVVDSTFSPTNPDRFYYQVRRP